MQVSKFLCTTVW